MLENFWHKKEKPFAGYAGFGGGSSGLAAAGGGSPIEATGGNYVLEPGDGYKYHTFTASGSFVVGDRGDDGEFEVLVVGGGGGGANGGGEGGGGGGAGGLRNFTITLPDVTGADLTYPVTVGDGGEALAYNTWPKAPGEGSESSFNSPGGPGNPGAGGAAITKVVATGGGAAGSYQNDPTDVAWIDGIPGGSGGGGGAYSHGGQQGLTVASPDGRSPTVQGYPGGGGATPYSNRGSGGGGSAEAGNWGGAPNGTRSYGGDGLPMPSFPYPACFPAPVAATFATPTNPLTGYLASPTSDHYAGGGGAGGNTFPVWGIICPGGFGGGGGGGARNSPNPGSDGIGYQGKNYLGGGGGGTAVGGAPDTGPGGEGVVIVRYAV